MEKDAEIELKLAINPLDVAAIRKLSLLRENCQEGPTRRKLFNTYFDRPDLVLKKNAMALRLRKMGGMWLWTWASFVAEILNRRFPRSRLN